MQHEKDINKFKFFEQLYETVPFGICQISPTEHGMIVRNINDSGAKLLGYSSAKAFMINPLYNLQRILKTNELTRNLEYFHNLKNPNDSFNYETTLSLLNGTFKKIMVNIQMVVNYDGSNIIQVVFYDITKQDNDKDALLIEKEKNEILLNYSEAYIIIHDVAKDSGTCSWSIQREDGTFQKKTKKYNNGRQILKSVVHPDDYAPLKKFLTDKIKNKHAIQIRLQNKIEGNHTYRWCHVNITLIRNRHGLAQIIATVKDINQLRTVSDENSALYELCDFTVQNAYEFLGLINVKTKEYKLFVYNTNIWRTYQKEGKYSELVDFIRTVRAYDQESIDLVSGIYLESLVALLSKNANVSIPIKVKYEDSFHWKKLEFRYFKNDSDKIVMVISDIHDEYLRKRRLEYAITEAQRANEAKSAFLINVSHEIRTPMNSIIGLSEILLNGPLPDDVRTDLTSIQNSGMGLLNIINDVLDYSKMESGKIDLINSSYRFDAILLSICNMIAIQLKNRPVRFLLEIDPQIPRVLYGDSFRLKQILVNLLGNAVKFTEKGYIKLVISKKLIDDKINLKFDIIDTGIGIKSSEIDKLFEKYYQVDSKKDANIKGTGLGLAISRQLSNLMDGDISVSSEYGVGTEFSLFVKQDLTEDCKPLYNQDTSGKILICVDDKYIKEMIKHNQENLKIQCDIVPTSYLDNSSLNFSDYLYVMMEKDIFLDHRITLLNHISKDQLVLLVEYGKRQEEVFSDYIEIQLHLFPFQLMNLLNGEKILTSYKTLPSLNHYKNFSGSKILVVDDLQTNLKVALGLIKPYNVTADSATSGEDAINKTKHIKYDLILMDNMMPGMDGKETMKLIKSSQCINAKTPIVVLTASIEIRREFSKSGFDDYLAKPIDVVSLQRILNKYLKESKSDNTSSGVTYNNPNCDSIDNDYIESSSIMKRMNYTTDSYLEILHIFQDELLEKTSDLEAYIDNNLDANIEQFTTIVHGLKSASKNVGANKLSDISALIESYGKKKQYDNIRKNFGKLISIAKGTASSITDILGHQESHNRERAYRDGFDSELIKTLRTSISDMDYEKVESTLLELDKYSYAENIQNHLDNMLSALDDFEYDKLDELIMHCEKMDMERI